MGLRIRSKAISTVPLVHDWLAKCESTIAESNGASLIDAKVLGWQTALVSTCYSAALAVQGMIALNNPGYSIPAWHGVLLTVGAVLLTIIFNTVLLRKLPTFEGGMLVIHVFAFLAVFIILWVMGDKASGTQMFTEFSDPQGWGSVGITFRYLEEAIS